MLGRRPRQAVGPSLATQLAALEKQAEQRLANQHPPYSRALLAADTGIRASMLAAWLSGERRPREFESLLRVVRALSQWAGDIPVDAEAWRKLHVDAGRRVAASDRSPTGWRRLRKRWWALIVSAVAAGAGVIITTVLAGAVAPVGPVIAKHVFGASSPARASATSDGLDTIQASAHWCCTYASLSSYTNGYYTPGSISTLESQLTGGVVPNNPDITAAGTAIIEIPVQTSDPNPILVGPPQVQILTRKPNVSGGSVGFVTIESQGSGAPADFKADLDDTRPVTVPYVIGGSGQSAMSSANAYYYVSSGSLEPLLLVVNDTGCDCTFDVKLTWLVQGKQHFTVLENGKQPFHMVGDSGLSWYLEKPVLGTGFKPINRSSLPAN